MDLDLRQLRSFVAVADTLHFGRAAAALGISQPALSAQIRRMEAAVGAALLTRTSRSVALTPAGAALRERAPALLTQADRALEEVGRVARGEAGRLDIGFVTSALQVALTTAVRELRRRAPELDVHLHEAFTAALTAGLQRGAVDVALMRDPEPADGLVFTPIHEEAFVAVVPADHPLAGRRSIGGAALAGEPFVFYPATAGARAHARNLAPVIEAGGHPRITQEASTWTTIINLVGAGLGVTIAPLSATAQAPGSVRTIRLTGTGARTTIAVGRRADDDRAAVEAIISLLQARRARR